jgi:hypothetical protein
MATSTYDIGDARRLAVAFTNSAGAATDPTVITFKLLKPDGTSVSLTYGVDGALIKDSTGNYHTDYLITLPGRHTYRWLGVGAIAAAENGEFYALKDQAA